MANPPVYATLQDMLSFEERIQALPDLPDRPFLLPGDYPGGELASEGEAKFQMQRAEREYQQRQELSGYLARPYDNCGPQSPAEQALEQERGEDVRRYHYGLPDSSPEDPPMAGGERQKPF